MALRHRDAAPGAAREVVGRIRAKKLQQLILKIPTGQAAEIAGMFLCDRMVFGFVVISAGCIVHRSDAIDAVKSRFGRTDNFFLKKR